MEERRDEPKYDPEGYEVLTQAILALLAQFPGLEEGERVSFATLRAEGGLAMFPGDGAVVDEEKRSVTGRVRQVCRYPFVALCRTAGMTEQCRADAKERLDRLGRWLGRQPMTAGGAVVQLRDYPALTGQRRLLDFSVQAAAYLYERDEHQTETWAVGLTARYENIFYL